MSVQLVSSSSSCYPWRGSVCFEVQNAGSRLRAKQQHQSSRADFHTSTWAKEQLTVLTKRMWNCENTLWVLNISLLHVAIKEFTIVELSVPPNNVKYFVNNILHCLLYCCRQSNICFGMSNLESDCSDYLPLRLDSLSTITSDFTYYLSCIMHHSSQITVLGTMLTWHPSTEILSRLTACIYIILILFLDSGKDTVPQETGIQNDYGGFKGYGVLLAHKYVFSSLLSFPTQSSWRVYGIPFVLEPWET